MNLVHAMPRAALMADARSLQSLLGILTFVFALLAALYVAVRAAPAVEGFFGEMNAGTLSLFGGITR